MSVSPDLLKAARETYALEYMLNDGLSSDALEKAIEAALEKHERTVMEKLAARAETLAISLEGEGVDELEDPYGDWSVPLRYFADQIRLDLGPEPDYEPRHGDVVEVTLTGSVIEWTDELGRETGEWSVFDDASGEEYFFGAHPYRKVRVRPITRAFDGEAEEA